jgi:hypothetical protein
MRVPRIVMPPRGLPIESNSRVVADSLLPDGEQPPPGAHLVSPRVLYAHHSIYIGNGRVIHYAGFAHGLRSGPVEEVSLERFAHGHAIRIRHEQPSFDHRQVVARARSRLGEGRYRLLTNNCEHFCAWVLRDELRSSQVERLRDLPRVLLLALRTPYQRLSRHFRAMQAQPRG